MLWLKDYVSNCLFVSLSEWKPPAMRSFSTASNPVLKLVSPVDILSWSGELALVFQIAGKKSTGNKASEEQEHTKAVALEKPDPDTKANEAASAEKGQSLETCFEKEEKTDPTGSSDSDNDGSASAEHAEESEEETIDEDSADADEKASDPCDSSAPSELKTFHFSVHDGQIRCNAKQNKIRSIKKDETIFIIKNGELVAEESKHTVHWNLTKTSKVMKIDAEGDLSGPVPFAEFLTKAPFIKEIKGKGMLKNGASMAERKGDTSAHESVHFFSVFQGLHAPR